MPSTQNKEQDAPLGRLTESLQQQKKRQHVSVQLYTAIILTTFYNLPHKNGANLTTIDIGKGRITFLILTTGAYIITIPFVIGKSEKSKTIRMMSFMHLQQPQLTS